MLELIPLCSIDFTLAAPHPIGNGPSGLRLVFEVEATRVEGDRVRGTMKGRNIADWFTLHGNIGSLDVRGVLETDDGALVYVEYGGRTNMEAPGAPIYVAPRFETGDVRYAWLNTIQAVGRGTLDGTALHYDWYEVR